VYIGNGFNQVYQSSDFSFAFVWSGDGIQHIKDINKKLKFLIHPKLSYISSDLLAQINTDKKSKCIANYLSDEKTLRLIENYNYYFSSYTNIKYISDRDFRIIYNQFLQALPKLQWIKSINSTDFDKINNSWDLIKLYCEKQFHNIAYDKKMNLSAETVGFYQN
jgi:hypothetical protein